MPNTTYRLDYMDQPLELRSMSVDPDTGFAKITGVVAAPGVLDYPELGRVETVGVRALSDPEANETLRGAPVVRLHPDVESEGGRVDVENVRWLTVGTVLSCRWVPETEELLFEASLTDAQTIAEVVFARETQGAPDTLSDCSPGYDVLEFDGQEQVKRKYNHLALVPYGRGDRARIHLDAQHKPKEPIVNEELRAMLDSYMAQMREDMRTDMSEMLDARFPVEEEVAADAEPSEEEIAEEAARMDALVIRRAEQRRVVADIAQKAGVDWNAEANVYANMRNVLETRIPNAYRADASDEAVVGMFEVFAAAQAATVETSDSAENSEGTRFDGFHAFSFNPDPSGQRNDAEYETSIEETLNKLAAARGQRVTPDQT